MNASGETYDSSRGELMSLAWNSRVVYLYANSICARAEVRNDEQPFLHRCEDCAGSITARRYSITRLIVDDMLLWIKFIKNPSVKYPYLVVTALAARETPKAEERVAAGQPIARVREFMLK